jgi:tetratricopeptide (TPR) repeat protein
MAEQLCAGALEKFPADANILCLSAQALIKLDQPELAKSRANAAIRLHSDFPKPHEILGQIFMRQGQTAEALIAFQRAAELDPTRADTQLKLGMVLMKSGRPEEGQKAIEASMRLNPARQQIAKAVEFERDGQPASAEKIYRQILTKDPDNVEALRCLATIATNNRHYGDAEVFLQRAVDLVPEFGRARAELVRVQLERDRFAEAVKNAGRLVRLDDKHADSYLLLASAHAAAGSYDEAIDAYELTLDRANGHRGALTGLGNMLKTVGRHADAVTVYRQCIQLHPDFAEAYWSLANLKTFRFEDVEVEAMEALLESDDLSAESIVQLHNALGLHYEARHEYERAFDFFERGNELRRQSERYDPVDTEDLNDRLIEVFNAEFLTQHEGSGDPDRSPIFIVGLPRSGSTLIEQILASHSQVEGTHELIDLSRITQMIPKKYQASELFPKSLLDLDTENFAELGALYVSRTRKYRAGRAHFVDKNPNNFIYVGILKLILPNARIIDARRHPLDSCLGSYKQLFAKGQPFSYDMFDLGEYYLQYRRLMKHWQDMLPGSVLEVRYEDVVENLEQEVARILDFCGLDWEDGCLRFYETDRAVKTASSEQVRQPIYSSSVNLWRNYESRLGELIEILEPELEKLAASSRPTVS